MKKGIIILIITILAGVGYTYRHQFSDWLETRNQEPVPESVTKEEVAANQNANIKIETNENTNTTPKVAKEVVLPEEFNLAVPFTTQAPFSEWNHQDDESCEEASILIAHYYWQDKIFTKEIAKDELNKIVAFEMDYFGYFESTDTEQTADLIKQLWGYSKVEIDWEPTIKKIKEHVYAGRPVILPTTGRDLGNPNFRSPGPLYHMLVVRGWNKENIITNDPGTRKGENYQYAPDVLFNSIHDWNGGDIYNGKKAMIVIYGEN